MAGGAIVALQPDHLGALEIALEAQDVVHLRPAPAVDRLVVVAHAADVAVALGQQPQPQVLGHVGVLVLVDEYVAEPAVILGQHVRMLGEDGQGVEQEVAEVAGVQHPQPVLILGLYNAWRRGRPRARRGRSRRRRGAPCPAASPCSSSRRSCPRAGGATSAWGRCRRRRSAASAAAPRRRCPGWCSSTSAPPARRGGAGSGPRPSGRCPASAGRRRRLADLVADALAHLARRLVGEGDRQQLPRPRPDPASGCAPAGW